MTVTDDSVREGMLLASPPGPVTLMVLKEDLRDRFAMAAMPSLIAGMHDWVTSPGEIAAKAYELADAMLRAREVKP